MPISSLGSYYFSGIAVLSDCQYRIESQKIDLISGFIKMETLYSISLHILFIADPLFKDN